MCYLLISDMIPVDPAPFTMAASVTKMFSFLHHSHPGRVSYFYFFFFLTFISKKTLRRYKQCVWQLKCTFSFILISGSGSHHFSCQAPCEPGALLSSSILFMLFTISVHCLRAGGFYRSQRLISAFLLVTIRMLKYLSLMPSS